MPAYRASSEGNFSELEKRVMKYLKYEKLGDSIREFYMVIAFAFYIMYYFINKQVIRRDPLVWEFLAILIGSAGISLIIAYLSYKKARKYKVEDDEWATYYTHLILNNLERFFRAKTIGMKEEYREQALKSATDFLSCIKERWKVGKFKLVQELVGDIISNLKENLMYRVIPALKEGDERELEKVKSIIEVFNNFSDNLTLENLRAVNELISQQIPERKPPKIKLHQRIASFLEAHKIVKHAIAIGGLALICIIIGYVVVIYGGISIDAAFTTLGLAFVTFAGVYLSRQRREET